MTPCSKKDDRRLMFKTSRPHFFKIILDHTICDTKLGIPRKFAYEYGNDLSSSVSLKVPNGAKWQVEIVRCDGDLWLQKGWQEFFDYYSLAHGSFLVFEFDQKNCGFNVIIFDKSASEIEYPHSEDNIAKESQEPKIQENDDHSVEILGPKTKRKSLLSLPPPHKKMKLENSTNFPTRQDEGNKKKLMNGKRGRKDHFEKSSCSILLEAAKDFTSVHPFFKLVMTSAYINHANVHVPGSFNMNMKERTYNTTFQVKNKCWPVKLNMKLPYKTGNFSAGWVVFARDNSLQVGDTCIFELINRKNMLIKVSIFRHVTDVK